MTIPRGAIAELMVLTDRPSFLAAARAVAGEADAVRVSSLEGGPRPTALNTCLATLAARPAAILLIDAEPDPSPALLLAQEIFDRGASPRVFIAGPADNSDLILRSQRAGASAFLPLPLERRVLLDAVHRLWRRMAPEAGGGAHPRGRVLSFLGTKGGCGTTTLATNLAVSLAERRESTLLVDLDLSAGDAALLLNLKPTFSVVDVVHNAHRLDRELLNGMILKHASGLEVLAASENPDRAAEVEPSQIPQILNFLREQFDYVVVNTADAGDPVALAAVTHSDLIHLVSCLDFLSLRRAQWALRRIAQSGLSKDLLRLVINRYEKNPYITLEEAEKILDLKVAWSIPAVARAAQEALNEGVPVVSRTPNGLRTSFDTYVGQLAGGGGARTGVAPKKRFLGLFPARGAKVPAAAGAAPATHS